MWICNISVWGRRTVDQCRSPRSCTPPSVAFPSSCRGASPWLWIDGLRFIILYIPFHSCHSSPFRVNVIQDNHFNIYKSNHLHLEFIPTWRSMLIVLTPQFQIHVWNDLLHPPVQYEEWKMEWAHAFHSNSYQGYNSRNPTLPPCLNIKLWNKARRAQMATTPYWYVSP